MIIPDNDSQDYVNNLIGGLAMNLAGPTRCAWYSTYSS